VQARLAFRPGPPASTFTWCGPVKPDGPRAPGTAAAWMSSRSAAAAWRERRRCPSRGSARSTAGRALRSPSPGPPSATRQRPLRPAGNGAARPVIVSHRRIGRSYQPHRSCSQFRARPEAAPLRLA
jgi:hypothetical protein